MKQPWIKVEQVRRQIPEGRELPARFDDFMRAEPPFRIEWNDLEHYALKPSATQEAVPFLRLPDGGLLALWYHEPTPAVVHIGGHGERRVITHDFDDFLRAIVARSSGLSDIDEGEHDFLIPDITGRPRTEGLEALQDKFNRWFDEHTSLLKPLRTSEAELLRQRVHGLAREMIGDGLSKVYTLSHSWWSMKFRIERAGTTLAITHLDDGKWYPVPEDYRLSDHVTALLKLVKNPDRPLYVMHVNNKGTVSLDGDRELLLVPPERTGV